MDRVPHYIPYTNMCHISSYDIHQYMSYTNLRHTSIYAIHQLMLFTNICYISIYAIHISQQDNDYVIIQHNFTQSPDVVRVLKTDTRNATTALSSDSLSGDWIINTTAMSYISKCYMIYNIDRHQ